MPELPEVEVTRRSFAKAIEGACIEDVVIGKPLRWPLGCPAHHLIGRRVIGVRRRGKYLLLDMDDGLLLMHLGMSGSLRFGDHLPAPNIHDHFELVTSCGTLRLHDPRRFGAVVYAADENDCIVIKLLGHLGMEPLSEDFTFEKFYAGLRASKQEIKQLLLMGRVVVGVGNIYAAEALFLAGIQPTALATHIGAVRARKLHAAITEVLSRAVMMGGSTLRDFMSTDGSAGHFQQYANVYGRDGLPCRVCGSSIRLVRQGQRSSYFCARCQRA